MISNLASSFLTLNSCYNLVFHLTRILIYQLLLQCFDSPLPLTHIPFQFSFFNHLCDFSLFLGPGRIPFSYLEDIHMRFMKNYGRVANYAPAYAMNDEFSRVLHQQMEFFSSNPSADTLNRVRGEVGEASIFYCHKFAICFFFLIYIFL